jgi:hypothetical protein
MAVGLARQPRPPDEEGEALGIGENAGVAHGTVRDRVARGDLGQLAAHRPREVGRCDDEVGHWRGEHWRRGQSRTAASRAASSAAPGASHGTILCVLETGLPGVGQQDGSDRPWAYAAIAIVRADPDEFLATPPPR